MKAKGEVISASKECAQKAVQIFTELSVKDLDSGEGGEELEAQIAFVDEFLRAAARRLPSQAAIDRDRRRKAKA